MSTIVVDACALLNITATGREVEILRAVDTRLLVPERARVEVRYHIVPDGDSMTRKPVDLSQLQEAGLLEDVSMDDCIDEFVECCSYLEDIDASVLASSRYLKLPILSDDRRIKNVASRYYHITTRSSLSLLRLASQRLGWGDEILKGVLRRVLVYANFLPPRGDDELAQWYRTHTVPGNSR
jgi:hypothetical protein